MEGIKKDQDKDRWDLLPWRQVRDIVKVLTFGAQKYEDNNWKYVERPKDRYFAALHRHLSRWVDGERIDSESGLPHLAHAACCILFLLWVDEEP